MLRAKKLLLVVCALLVLGCNAVTQALPAGPVPSTTTPNTPVGAAVTETPSAAPGATLTETITPTEEPSLTPTLTETATLDPAHATQAASMGSMGVLMNGSIQMYANPAGVPLKAWHNIPILPQATAGQEFSADIYSYKAAVSLGTALQFYKTKAQALGIDMQPGSGHGGTGSMAYHDASFLSFKVSIIITSYDNDAGNVIVILAVAP
jgi:hypothetical protein